VSSQSTLERKMNDFRYTAIIIEPRRHKALHLVLQNALECLSNEWRVVVFHGKNNREYVNHIMELLSEGEERKRVSLVQLPVHNLNQKTYSALLTNPNAGIYEHIHTEYFLIFQTDTIMFKEHIHLMDYYIAQGVDYIGAPWLRCNYPPTRERDFIGNGGFSLRKKSTMLRIMQTQIWNEHEDGWQEDLYFCRSYEGITLKKPSYDDAARFCVDEVFSPIVMACHRPWCHRHFPELAKLYPICEKLFHLQSEEEEERITYLRINPSKG